MHARTFANSVRRSWSADSPVIIGRRPAAAAHICSSRFSTSCPRKRPGPCVAEPERPALFQLRSSEPQEPASDARAARTAAASSLVVPALREPWTIRDAGRAECWAIVGPAIEAGGELKAALVRFLLGRHFRSLHPDVEIAHPFLKHDEQGRSAGQAMQHVSFSTRPGRGASAGGEVSGGGGGSGSGGGGGSGFVDYSARYGAIRTEDRVTLLESLLEQRGIFTGHIASMRVSPDPLAADEGRDTTGKVKWGSEAARERAVRTAREAVAEIRARGALLSLDDELLHRPLIALSNGQTRRARILAALLAGGECIVMEEPYTGLDPPTRERVSQLLAELHAKRAPRIVLVLREQDAIPAFVTHLLRVDEAGGIPFVGALGGDTGAEATAGAGAERGGYEVVKRNSERGMGQGDSSSEPIVRMSGVTVDYDGKRALSDVTLDIPRGSRTVLVGDNGSGKTTLLSLLLGDHPLSYAFPARMLSLFGHARRDPPNSTTRLARRVGHFSPELYNAFPRRPVENGGLTVAEAVASGFGNIFSRRQWSDEQWSRVHRLLARFADLLKDSKSRAIAARGGGAHAQDAGAEDAVRELGERAFVDLSAGSQAVVLLLRALVHSPELLVLDEPFQGMDRKQVERARHFLDHVRPDPVEKEDQEQLDAGDGRWSMIVVSHYEEEWPMSCGRLIRLKEGKLVESF